MQPAPAIIPAVTEVSFPAGFTPGGGDRGCLEVDPVADQLGQAGPLRQTHHRDQARARDQMLVTKDRDRPRPLILFTAGAFCWRADQDLDTPDYPTTEGTSASGHAATQLPIHGLRLRAGALRPSTRDGRAIRSKAGLARTHP